MRQRLVLVALAASVLTGLAGLGAATVLITRDPAPILRLDPTRLTSAEPRVAAAAPSRSGDRRGSTLAVDPAWVTLLAEASGVPPSAVGAYGLAALRLAHEQPACHLGWTTLAGIGSVESAHGTTGGRVLLDDGRSSSPVIGPTLDGRGDVAAIPATPAATALHGDRVWDHAVGPLQFLPSTWDRWGSDGDDDGVADPFDLDDAAYAAGRYLCAGGGDLATATGWHDAVLSYNHAESYVVAVYAAASAYAG